MKKVTCSLFILLIVAISSINASAYNSKILSPLWFERLLQSFKVSRIRDACFKSFQSSKGSKSSKGG